MTRAEKAKAMSTRRDPSGFEHVDASIRASRGGKRKSGKGGAASTPTATARRKAVRKNLKTLAPFTAATIQANRRAMQEAHANIEKDVRGIITR
jgi:hypothetical protein